MQHNVKKRQTKSQAKTQDALKDLMKSADSGKRNLRSKNATSYVEQDEEITE
jgi:hypothetical protein